MSEASLPLFLSIHLVCVFIYAVVILTGISNHKKTFFPLILFIPGFGLLTALVIDIYYFFTGHNQKPVEIATFSLDENIYWKPIRNRQEENNLVPLEEAILINDTMIRRKLMLESLYDNPSKYIDILMIARKNDDIETVHYASTTISKIQRDFQLEIQRLAVAIEKEPDNLEILDEYIEVVQNYINSNILEDYLLKHQRILFDNILSKRLEFGKNNKEVLFKKIENNLALKNFPAALHDSRTLQKTYPDDEQVWIQALQVCVESKDQQKLQETIDEIKNLNIVWTNTGRKVISTWLENG